jgi:DNA-binding NarL/FixJ family response regulator
VCLLMLDDPGARYEVMETFAATASSRTFDAFVFALRLHPAIVEAVAEQEGHHNDLADILGRCGEQRRALPHNIRAKARRAAAQGPLTARELQVYSLLAEGRSNREIARALFIAETTAKVHVRNILRKLNLRTRTEVALHAARSNDL